MLRFVGPTKMFNFVHIVSQCMWPKLLQLPCCHRMRELSTQCRLLHFEKCLSNNNNFKGVLRGVHEADEFNESGRQIHWVWQMNSLSLCCSNWKLWLKMIGEIAWQFALFIFECDFSNFCEEMPSENKWKATRKTTAWSAVHSWTTNNTAVHTNAWKKLGLCYEVAHCVFTCGIVRANELPECKAWHLSSSLRALSFDHSKHPNGLDRTEENAPC